MTFHALAELNPEQIASRIATQPILVLPFGTIEWHSHHLPLGLDGLVGEAIAEDVADRADAVLAPVSYWAVGGVPYPYTLNLSIDIIEPLLVALFEQFSAMGLRTVVAFTGHFGLDQTLALKRAALSVMERSSATILALTPYDLVSETYAGDHAGIGETSLMWAIRPDLVDLDAVGSDEGLPGVIGEDPRPSASHARGAELRELIVSRTTGFTLHMHDASALQRHQYIEAVRAGVSALDETSRRRRSHPKSSVPPIATPAYLQHCAALNDLDFAAARAFAEAKRANLQD